VEGLSISGDAAELRAELLEAEEVASDVRAEWDSLAVARAKPFSSPSWMLPWWRHARPSRAALRIVAVRRGDELIGLLPLIAEPIGRGLIRYRLLASTTAAHVEPLARTGYESDVAEAAADLLAADRLRPDVVSLDGVSTASRWPALLGRHWSTSGAWVHRGMPMPAPRLSLAGRTYDDWFGSLSRRRRSEFRRRRRRLEERGATVRLARTEEETVAGLGAFADLHYERWRSRGGSRALDRGMEAMLAETAHELLPSDRFRLWSIEVEGRPVSSAIFVGAGGEVSYWLGGFDEQWGAYAPALETVRVALEHAWEAGDRAVDFGPGGQRYKYTFADGEDAVTHVDLVPRTASYRLARARLAPEHAWARTVALRYEAFRRLPPGAQQRLKELRTALRADR
jgi:CelD/BcsL family acetyltransferase involved in cellulose biosynthesis